jgi:hypothetical protein
MCSQIFTPLQQQLIVKQWARDTLGLTEAEYSEKSQVYKRLDRIWEDDSIRRYHPYANGGWTWNQSNTILIDDSPLKALKQPFNHIEIPEYTKRFESEEKKIPVLGQVVAYLDALQHWNDVSAYMKRQRFHVATSPHWDWERREPFGYSQH